MKNIWNIFRADWRRLTASVVAVVVLLGLCLVPCLYAWFNILSNWDPYGTASTSRISVAVASEDAGCEVLGLEVNIGALVLQGLESNDQMGWVFVDSRAEALDGVESGDYYAALIVPDVLQPHAFVPLPAPTGLERARAYLKVEDGCDQFCHYCVVPYARGPVRSLPLEDALAQGRVLIAQGYPEIVLTGIHIGAYGQDFPGQRPNLGDLLQAFLALPGLGRLHLGSLEPQQCTETLLELVLNQEKICRHLHIPLQAGCDKTLAAMGRRYDTTAYAALCARIRSMDPQIALTTDVMVGYPGESEADFATTYHFCQQIGFADMHVFAYSPRKRTVAAELPGQIAPPEKERRSKALLELAGQLRTNYGAAFVGQTLQFLFEQVVEIDGQPYYQGHSENYLPLLLPARPDGPPVGRLVTVCGKTFADDRLYGEWLED